MLVKEYSDTMASPPRMCFSPTPLVRTSQSSRGSNTSTLDCSLVALDLSSDTGNLEVDDSAFCSPHVPENSNTKEQFAVRFQQMHVHHYSNALLIIIQDVVPKLTRQEKVTCLRYNYREYSAISE